MVLGDNEQTNREAWADAHLGDRDSLELMGEQNELAAAIFALKEAHRGLPAQRPSAEHQLLGVGGRRHHRSWYLGRGDRPRRRRPALWPRQPRREAARQHPALRQPAPGFLQPQAQCAPGLPGGQRQPLYPFGYGLSYTQFEISEPVLAKTSIGVNDSVAVDVTVKNVGSRAGDEVVQLYVRDDVSSVTRPVKELKHFKRIHLQPGESQQVRFTLKPADLASTTWP